MQSNQETIVKESWWLMYCCFPNLRWTRLQVYSDRSTEVLDSDGSKFKFPNQEEAQYFLLEDEYISFENLDLEDEEEYWGDFPSFIGLNGFLERIRFAIDPNTDTFYFGQI
ncbi:MAG: hypothetical protein WBV73_17210 [Phormidium sp.]